jgi:hypothetical protein
MKSIDLQRLKKLAIAAVPGPWKSADKDEHNIGIFAPWSDKVKPASTSGWGDCRGIHICETSHQKNNPCVSKDQANANMEFIAAADPETLIGLIDEIETMKVVLDQVITSKVSAINLMPGDILLWRQQGKTGTFLSCEIEITAREIRRLYPENPVLISADDSQLEVMSDELLDKLGLIKKPSSH